MNQDTFQPLTIETDQLGNLQTINSVQGALDFLTSKWPADNDVSQERAIKMCRLALQGSASADVARDIFIEAAKLAGIAIRQV